VVLARGSSGVFMVGDTTRDEIGGLDRQPAVGTIERPRVGETGVGERVVGVERDGALERLDRQAQRARGALMPVVAPLQVELVGVEIVGWEKSEVAMKVIDDSVKRYREKYLQVGP